MSRLGGSCTKSTLGTLNVLFLALGAAIVGLGVWIREKDTTALAASDLPIPIICAGAAVMVVSFLGCCGAFRESRTLLGLYSLIIFLIIALQIAGGALYAVKKDDADTLIRDGWNDLTNNEKVEFQNKFECCGLEVFNQNAGQPCPVKATEPCMAKLKSDFKKYAKVIIGVAIGFAAIEILGLFFACSLMSSIKKAEKTEEEQAMLHHDRQSNRHYV